MTEKRATLSINQKSRHTVSKVVEKADFKAVSKSDTPLVSSEAPIALKTPTVAHTASEQPKVSRSAGIARRRVKNIHVIAYAAERGLDLSQTQITRALMVYINRAEYRSAVAQGGQRIDLHGLPAGEVDEKAVEHARRRLAKLKTEVKDDNDE